MLGIVAESSAQACVLTMDGGLDSRPICCTITPPAALPAPPVGKYDIPSVLVEG